MNCQKAYSKLLVLSRAELELPTNIKLVQHLHSCPFCDSFRQIWLKVDKDTERGLQFKPPDNFWSDFMSESDYKNKVKTRSVLKSLLWKLDWLTYPEKSLKWAGAFFLIVTLTVGGVKLNQLQSIPSPGLPNQLVISKFLGNNTVQETLESGILLGRYLTRISRESEK